MPHGFHFFAIELVDLKWVNDLLGALSKLAPLSIFTYLLLLTLSKTQMCNPNGSSMLATVTSTFSEIPIAWLHALFPLAPMSVAILPSRVRMRAKGVRGPTTPGIRNGR